MKTARTLIVGLALACSDSTGPVNIGGVIADAQFGSIVIQNRTTQPVYTFVVGRNAAALVDWIPCSNPTTCPSIQPGDTKTEPYPEGPLAKDETEALIYWWHLVPSTPAGAGPDSIRVGIVKLK